MIGQYLSNTNKNATVSISQNFLELNKALVIFATQAVTILSFLTHDRDAAAAAATGPAKAKTKDSDAIIRIQKKGIYTHVVGEEDAFLGVELVRVDP